MNERVWAIATDSRGNVYAGGQFTMAGGKSANNIAVWNGATWSPLGSGTGRQVSAIAVAPSGDVYVDGDFWTAGGRSVNRVAKWNGFDWSSLDGGMIGAVSSLLVDSAETLYAGGFLRALVVRRRIGAPHGMAPSGRVSTRGKMLTGVP